MTRRWTAWATALSGLLWVGTTTVQPVPLPPDSTGAVLIQWQGATVPAGLQLTDHRGRRTSFDRFMDRARPVLLTLNYFGCENVCSVQLHGLSDALSRVQ